MSSSTSNRFARAFSLRDKRRTPSKTRSQVVDDFHNLFCLDDGAKKLTKDEEKKMHELSYHLNSLGLTNVPEKRMEYALRAHGNDGEVKKAVNLLLLFENSVAGVLKQFDPKAKMLGAENREKVTCYLDSLLFAMFAKSDVFEAILFNNFEDEPRRRLVTIIRLWVNLLRTGRLITTDITQHLQAALAECGWADAAKVRQQDASEAFGFITDKLELPLLTMRTDLFHSGKEDVTDDHKFITERMLDVAIPEDIPEGQKITLEMCLEEYFNNRVEVKRHLERRNTVNSVKSTSSTDKAASSSEKPGSSVEKTGPVVVETTEISSSMANTPTTEQPPTNYIQRPTHLRERATSIFSERRVEVLQDKETETSEVHGPAVSRQRTASTRKEVSMPAWQFINLIPWYTDNTPGNDSSIKAHFATKRPTLGICLKRYKVSPKGNPTRLNTHIDIPLEMASPHFDSGDDVENDSPQTVNFKLVLQSVVCHRGISVDSGHYIAFVRAHSPEADRNDSFHDMSGVQSHDASHDIWLRFDDLASERVRVVDITKVLNDESPYLLFYRVAPIHDDPALENPPPYTESQDSFEIIDRKLNNLPSSSRHSLDEEFSSTRASLEVPRFQDQPSRNSISSQRRSSVLVSDSGGASLKMDQIATDPPTPLEESKQNLVTVSRQNTKNSKADSRSPEPTNEKRFSMSMSRIASRLSRDKLTSPENEAVVDDETPDMKPGKEETGEELKMKAKDHKKKMFKNINRRASASGAQGHSKAKEPDRDCALM